MFRWEIIEEIDLTGEPIRRLFKVLVHVLYIRVLIGGSPRINLTGQFSC